MSTDLSVLELKDAELKLWRFVQRVDFSIEKKQIQEDGHVGKKSVLNNFNVFEDSEGLLRIETRIKNKKLLTYKESNPIVLLPSSHLVKLFLEKLHFSTKHGSVSEVLFKARKKFWIIRARQRIQGIVKGCIICKKARLSRPIPIMADLPLDRMNPTYPFTVVGLDHFGPFHVKIGSETKKSYGLIVTCFVTRAINLEWSEDLSANKLMNALRRHCARYGYPAKIHSDNSKTFEKGSKHIDSWGGFVLTDGIQKLISDEGIEWNFISPLSPWKGGVWERLIRSVKEKLKKTIGKGLWNYDDIVTLFCEVSSVLNSRPLVYVSDSDTDQFPLTPELFITGGMPKMLSRDFEDGYISNASLRSAEKSRRNNINQFWRIWVDYYLKLLRGVHEVVANLPFKNPEIGQIVLVEQIKASPYFWPLGRIIEVYPDDKGIVRTVRVLLGNGEIYVRPTKLLRYLELDKAI